MDKDRVHLTFIVLNTVLFAAVLILSIWVYMLIQKKPSGPEKRDVASGSSTDSTCLLIPDLNGKNKYSFITKITRGNLEGKVELSQTSGLTLALSDRWGVSKHRYPALFYKNVQVLVNNQIVPLQEATTALNNKTAIQIEETFDMSKTQCPNLESSRIMQISE